MSSNFSTQTGEEFYNSDIHGNITLNLRGNAKLKANSVVLATNSSLFNKLITNDKLTTLDITEYTPDSVKSFIRYLYLGQIQSFVDCGINNFWGICYLAREYKVSWLLTEMPELLSNILFVIEENMSHLFDVLYRIEEFGIDSKNTARTDEKVVKSLRKSLYEYLLLSKSKKIFLKFTVNVLLTTDDNSWTDVHECIAKFCTTITYNSKHVKVLVVNVHQRIVSTSSAGKIKVLKSCWRR